MRQERVRRMCHLLQKEISRIIYEEIDNPRVKLLTVASVKMSKDLKFAKVYMGIIGSPEEKKEVFKAIKGAEGYIQHKIAETIEFRYTPHLTFYLDESVDEAFKIMDILKKIETENKSGVSSNQ